MTRFDGFDCDVLVVGAGPTGLMAADLLKRWGVDVRIVDDRLEPSRESRAFAVAARSMELFLSIDLADAILQRAVLNSRARMHVRGRLVGGLDFDTVEAPDTPFPFITLHPQSDTERVLIEDLSRLGLAVERGRTVRSVVQDATAVTAQFEASAAGGAIRSRYLLGADGAHSVVRKALGLAFAGAQYPQTFLLADCRVDWPLDHAGFRGFLNGERVGLFLPLDGTACSRVMVTEPRPADASDLPHATALELGELERAFAAVSELPVKLSDPRWVTRFHTSHRGVDRYQVGRVFLAGDAAHIHSPAGGQGMNTGLQDAANLAWKLAAVLRGAAPDLLASYDSERRPVGRDVVRTTDAMFEVVAGRTGWEAAARDLFARPAAAALSHLPTVQTAAFRKLAEIDIAYGPSPCVEPPAPSAGAHGPQPGQRAPNAPITRHRDVFDLLSGARFTLLALSRRPLERDEAEALVARLRMLEGPAIAARVVARLTAGRVGGVELTTAAAVFAAYGLPDEEAQALLLVRPDGYLAWRSDSLDVDACRPLLRRLALEGSAGNPAAGG
ncbi:FAD-dependent monooxygenase [Mangrovibrevibacter kandeliae]|uniref:FAD-dependent monooxygenase n=1 Tax=Mangrovibrevibacter kandeliae TaxID=2968473 RepID=UPI002118FA9D|nr:FAD-dependent monooxygenase [Aurantimonas sp. CSK15Z-1]MCQ8784147.1 FAD-dependent monooxygenase [Aurantimonas sp. CSK15Z-1]